MGLSSGVRQGDLERVSTGRVSGILCMSQGTWDHISDLMRAMAVGTRLDLVKEAQGRFRSTIVFTPLLDFCKVISEK